MFDRHALVLVNALSTFLVAKSADYNVTVDPSNIITTVPDIYYGFTFDFWESTDPTYGKKWENAGILTVNLTNENLITLASAVSPAYLRIGGSPEDSIVYNVTGQCSRPVPSVDDDYRCSQVAPANYGCLTMERWNEITTFAHEIDAKLLFGLNCCYGRWNRSSGLNLTMISQFLNYTINSNNINNIENLYAFELCNELDFSIDPGSYASDFVNLKNTINNLWSDKTSKYPIEIPKTVGPDIGTNPTYLNSVLGNISRIISDQDVSEIMHAMTYHQYPNCGFPNSNVSVFDLNCLGAIGTTAKENYDIATPYYTLAWAGESSEHSGGGVYNQTNVFASSFFYMYQLCDSVQNGVTGVFRQCLMGGDYELINKTTFLPNSDYFMLYIWKNLFGQNAFELNFTDTAGNTPSSETYIRSWAYDSTDYISKTVSTDATQHILIILINYHLSNKASVNVNVLNQDASDYTWQELHIRANGSGIDGLKSNDIYINSGDFKLEFDASSQSLPDFSKWGVASNGVVTLEPASIVLVNGWK